MSLSTQQLKTFLSTSEILEGEISQFVQRLDYELYYREIVVCFPTEARYTYLSLFQCFQSGSEYPSVREPLCTE